MGAVELSVLRLAGLMPMAARFLARSFTDSGDRLVIHEPEGLLWIDAQLSRQPHPGA